MAKKTKKLCKLMDKGKIDKVAKLARDAQYICQKCGRSAADNANLCRPTKL